MLCRLFWNQIYSIRLTRISHCMKAGRTYLNFSLTQSHTFHDFYASGLVRLWVALVLSFEYGQVLRTVALFLCQHHAFMEDGTKRCVCVRAQRVVTKKLQESYRVLRRFWRARARLSTSGGRLGCECTRNANTSEPLFTLPFSDEDGQGQLILLTESQN